MTGKPSMQLMLKMPQVLMSVMLPKCTETICTSNVTVHWSKQVSIWGTIKGLICQRGTTLPRACLISMLRRCKHTTEEGLTASLLRGTWGLRWMCVDVSGYCTRWIRWQLPSAMWVYSVRVPAWPLPPLSLTAPRWLITLVLWMSDDFSGMLKF